jgi:hypothetical protein
MGGKSENLFSEHKRLGLIRGSLSKGASQAAMFFSDSKLGQPHGCRVHNARKDIATDLA